MSIPKNITREHLIQAIEKINHDEIPKDGDSMYYDVKYNSKFYPPKLVVSIANLFANGIELDRNSFDGGMNSPCFDLLINNGFEILTKELEEITSVIELKKYFRHFRDNDLLLKFFDFTKGVLWDCNLSETDKRIAFTLRKNGKQISINLGRKLIIAIYKSNNDNFFCFHLLENDVPWAKELPGYLKEEIFKINPPARLLYFKASLELINNKELLEKIKAGIMEWLPSVESAGQPERHNRLIYRLINDIDMRNDFFSTSSNSLLPEILEAIESESFQNFIHEDEFYFEKAKNAFHEFKSLQLSDPSILEKIEQDFKVGGKFKDYYKGLNQDSEEYTITNSIAKLISYCDSNAAFKNELNETRDKRVLAKAGVRQNNWFENLIKFKREENYTELPSSIKNALIYLENPNQGITMLSDNHREKFIKAFVPSKQFTSENFIDDILAFFKPYEIRCKNELNYTRALSAILYNYQPVRNLWLDIVEENDQNLNLNYWVFQGNPKVYDFETAIRENLLEDWTVSAHKEKIKKGDKVILWISGKKAGCYALAEITSEPYLKVSSLDDHLFSNQEKSELKADFKITHNLIDNPILKDDIVNIKELSELKVGNQGTNFVATKEEYDKILELLKNKTAMKYWLYAPGENANMWDEFYEKGIMGLGWDELGDLNEYANKQEISLKLQEIHNTDSSKANDSTANYDFKENVSIGDIIISKKGRNAYLGYGYVTSDYYYDQSAESYKHRRKVRWEKYGHWDTNHSIVLKTLTDITNVKSKSNPSLMAPEAILNIINGIQSDKKNQMPINQILYGPPGTGKTYELKSHYFPKYSSQESSISAEQHFKNVVSECSWWQVIALALLDLDKPSKVVDIMNNRWVKMKSELSDAKGIRSIMWSALQSHTIHLSETVGVKQRQSPYIFNKKDESFWEILENEVKEQIPELYEIINSVEKFSPRADKKFDRYFFTTFHQSYSYEDFIEGIKPVLEIEESDGSVAYRIEDGIFKQICKKAEIDPENQYAIFIDEINRGNISAIFGELITLIEQDKRKGAENEMSVILPYSKKAFSVPQNLDIIGTMNTADRSVEALDTALRRRFSFVEMLPKPELLKDKVIEGIELKKLLETINERIEVLVDRDHTIGHAFFINDNTIENLRNTFANKIIPLLQEYFYGDYSKMELVIGSAFFEKKEVSKVKFAVKSEDFEAEGQVYHIKNISDTSVMSDKDFITALEILIKGEA